MIHNRPTRRRSSGRPANGDDIRQTPPEFPYPVFPSVLRCPGQFEKIESTPENRFRSAQAVSPTNAYLPANGDRADAGDKGVSAGSSNQQANPTDRMASFEAHLTASSFKGFKILMGKRVCR